jgi:hypothetical protein
MGSKRVAKAAGRWSNPPKSTDQNSGACDSER